MKLQYISTYAAGGEAARLELGLASTGAVFGPPFLPFLQHHSTDRRRRRRPWLSHSHPPASQFRKCGGWNHGSNFFRLSSRASSDIHYYGLVFGGRPGSAAAVTAQPLAAVPPLGAQLCSSPLRSTCVVETRPIFYCPSLAVAS